MALQLLSTPLTNPSLGERASQYRCHLRIDHEHLRQRAEYCTAEVPQLVPRIKQIEARMREEGMVFREVDTGSLWREYRRAEMLGALKNARRSLYGATRYGSAW